MDNTTYSLDAVDCAMIGVFRRLGRVSNARLATEVGIARGTVQSRLARLTDANIIESWGPELNPHRTNYQVVAFTTLSIAQGAHDDVVAEIAKIPQVLEVHVVTGAGDLLCRVVATSNDQLHEVVQLVVSIPGVIRSESQLALHTPVRRSLADLIGEA